MKRARLLGSSFTQLLLCALLQLFVVHTALAQTGSSSVRGSVLDPQDRPVAGVTLTLTNVERNF